MQVKIVILLATLYLTGPSLDHPFIPLLVEVVQVYNDSKE